MCRQLFFETGATELELDCCLQITNSGRLATPESIVEWFESFEDTTQPSLTSTGEWQLVSVYEGCGKRREFNASGAVDGTVCANGVSSSTLLGKVDSGPKVAGSDAFKIVCSGAVAHGICALRADSVAHDGGAMQLALNVVMPAPGKRMLRGYYRDECGQPEGSHWMSGNFQACRNGQDVRTTID